MNKQAQKSAQELLTFIDKNPVSYFAVANIVKALQDNGYRSLNEGKKRNLNLVTNIMYKEIITP